MNNNNYSIKESLVNMNIQQQIKKMLIKLLDIIIILMKTNLYKKKKTIPNKIKTDKI